MSNTISLPAYERRNKFPLLGQGDTASILTITWVDEDGNAINLTGYIISGVFRNTQTDTTYAFTGTFTLTDATNGIFTYQASAADVGNAGQFEVQLLATSGASPYVSALAHWEVIEQLAATAVASEGLVGVSTSEGAYLTAQVTTIAGITDDNLLVAYGDAVADSGIAKTAIGDATSLNGRAFADTLPTDGQAIKWNNTGSTWEPGTAGNVTYFTDETGSTYSSAAPPAAPITPPAGIASGDTLIERYGNAELKWDYTGSWALTWVTEDSVPAAGIAVAAGAFATAAEPTDAELQTWVDANHANSVPGQTYLYRGAAGNPEFVWMDNGDGTTERTKTSIHETINIFKHAGGTSDYLTWRDGSNNTIANWSHDNIFEVGKAGVLTGKIKATHNTDGTVEFGGNTLSFSRASVNYIRTTASGSSLIFQTENINLIYLRNNQDMTFYATGDYKMMQIDYSAKRIGMGADPSGAALDIRSANSDNIQQWRNAAGTIQLDISNAGILDFQATMGDSALDPATDAPSDWVEVKIGGTTRYIPAYAAS